MDQTETQTVPPFDDSISLYLEDAINTQQQEIAKKDAEKFIQGLEDRVPIFSPSDSSAIA